MLLVILGDIKIILILLSLMAVSTISQWLVGVGVVINVLIIEVHGSTVKRANSILSAMLLVYG
jgi:hypothetical protein